MLEFLVEGGNRVDLVEFAVHFHALEALFLQLGQFLFVFTFAPAHDGGEQIKAGAFGHGQRAVHHLGDGLAFDGKARGGRIGHANAGIKQAQVIVDFGNGADSGARVAAGCFLLDGDGGGKTVDLVHIRLLHHFEELAGIGRQAFDIAALAFGIDGVEGERAFAGARKAGEHDELIARKLDRDILQVMLARALDGDDVFLFSHDGKWLGQNGNAGNGGFQSS